MKELTLTHPLPLYIYGREVAPNERVWPEDRVLAFARINMAPLAEQLAQYRHKAEQYDSIVAAVQPADGGRYRADTISRIESLASRVERAEAEAEELHALLREYRQAPKFSSDHDAIKSIVALEDKIDALLQDRES